MQHEMEKLQKVTALERDTCDDLCIWKEIFHLLHSSLTTSTMEFTHQPLVHHSAIASAEFPSQTNFQRCFSHEKHYSKLKDSQN